MTSPPLRVDAIPRSVAHVIGEVLGMHYYRHQRLEVIFMEAGAPGAVPEGNCVDKCVRWLLNCNDEPLVAPFEVLGRVLEAFMDADIEDAVFDKEEWLKRQARVNRTLERSGLSYRFGGRIVGPGATTSTRSLKDIISARDLGALEREVERALDSVVSDPPTTLTAACALVEAACKVYIEDEGLPLPTKQTVSPLWGCVREHLGLDANGLEDSDMKRILAGLASIVDGLGAFRTHAGSAHGRGRRGYKVAPRHARLALNAAHSLVLFMLETWDARRETPPSTRTHLIQSHATSVP